MPNAVQHHLHRHAALFAAASFAWIVLGGCASQGEMTNLWRDPSLQANSIHKVLVVAIRKDPVRRRACEDAFVDAFAARGIAATPSYRDMGAAPPDTDQVIDAVRRNGFDAVVTSSRLPDEPTSRRVEGAFHDEQRVSVRGYDNHGGYGYGYGYGRFHPYWVTVQDPSYIETDTVIRVQTDLWETGRDGGRLVWSGTLSMLESTTGRTVKRAVDEEIMPELQKQGIVGRRTN